MPNGILEISVKLLRPPKGRGKSAMRRPLTRTRVWFGPKPRKSTCCAPGEKSAPPADCWLWVSPPFWVSERNRSGMVVKPLALISAAFTTEIGAGPSNCERGIREPVTWMVSRVSGGSSAGGWVAARGAGGVACGAASDAEVAATIRSAPESARATRKPLPSRS